MVIICVQLFTSLTYYPKSKLCFDSSLIEHPPPNLFVLPVPPKCIVSLSTSIKVACCGHFEGPVSMRPPGAWIKTCSSHVKSVFCQFYYEPRHKNSGGVKEEISRCLTTPAVGLLRNGEQESPLCPVSLFCPLPAPDQQGRPSQLTPHHHAPPKTVKQISQGKGHQHLWLLRHSRMMLETK